MNAFGRFLGNRIRRFRSDQGGIAVEAAFIMPILILLLAMAVDVVNYFIMLRQLSVSANAAGELIASTDGEIDTEGLDAIFAATAPGGADAAADNDIGFFVRTFRTDTGTALPRWTHRSGTQCEPPNTLGQSLPAEGRDVIVTGTCGFYSSVTGGAFGMVPRAVQQFAVTSPRKSETLLCEECED